MKQNPLLAEKLFGRNSEQIFHDDEFSNEIDFSRNMLILQDAEKAWSSLSSFRRQSERYANYVFGDQWGDMVVDPDCGRKMTERQHIENQGKVALTNNRMRGIVSSVIGLFSSTKTEPICVARKRESQSKGETMSIVMQSIYQNNETWELDRRNLEYFLITGFACFRSRFGDNNNNVDTWTKIVNYNKFFFDTHTEDVRTWDCNLVGQIHDLSWNELLKQFANDEDDERRLRSLYAGIDKERMLTDYLDFLVDKRSVSSMQDFFIPEDNTQARVIEVWRKETEKRFFVHDRLSGKYYKEKISKEKVLEYDSINEQRTIEQTEMGVTNLKLIEYSTMYDTYWQCYFMTPHGVVLDTFESPYRHKSHPFSFRIFPYFNKHAYPFVGTFLDQQRYINRLITLQDFIIGSSAKGVLMFPEEALPSNMSMDDVADQWVRYNGIIYYKGSKGVNAPQQIVSQQKQAGVTELLQTQLSLIQDISGVQGALQGETPRAGTPASLYAQQTQNSANSLTDVLEVYKTLREARDRKVLSITQQHYTDARIVNVAGAAFGSKSTEYNPAEMSSIDFDLSITESTASPAFRAINNDILMSLFQSGQIGIKHLLEVGSFPFSDKLLQALQVEEEKAEKDMANGQQPDMQGQNEILNQYAQEMQQQYGQQQQQQ